MPDSLTIFARPTALCVVHCFLCVPLFFLNQRTLFKGAKRDDGSTDDEQDDDNNSDRDGDDDELLQRDHIEQEESFFADLFNPTSQKLWEPFVSISVEDHDAHLAQLSNSIPQSSPTSCFPKKKHSLPPRFWEPVQRCLKNAQYYMILCSLESHVIHFLDYVTEGLRSPNMDWESSLAKCQFDEPSNNHLGVSLSIQPDKFPHMCLVLPDSYQRLLCHAVCAYYMLESESENGPDGRRITAVKIRQLPKSAASRGWTPSYPKTLLAEYVMDQQNE